MYANRRHMGSHCRLTKMREQDYIMGSVRHIRRFDRHSGFVHACPGGIQAADGNQKKGRSELYFPLGGNVSNKTSFP